MSRLIWLDDRSSGVAPPDGIVLVEDDVAFLQHVNESSPLYVRGGKLCRWARRVGAFQRWNCRDVGSPLETLQQAVAGLNISEAGELLTRLGQEYWSIEGCVTARSIAQRLIPTRDWNLDSPDATDAAGWLVWMIVQDLPNIELLVATAAGREVHGPLRDPFFGACFGVSNHAEATDVLVKWMQIDGPISDWPEFPLSTLPNKVTQEIGDRVQERLMVDGGHSALTLIEANLPRVVANQVARRAKTFMENHPEQLSQSILDWLEGHIGAASVVDLRLQLRPIAPSMPPQLPGEVTRWFIDEYLPWRRWTVVSQDRDALVAAEKIGRQFGEWYLETLPRLLLSSEGSTTVSWVRSWRLRNEVSTDVTCLMVLDGFGYADVPRFLAQLNEWSPRLQVLRTEPVLTSVPTITDFTKQPVVMGHSPMEVSEAVSSMSALTTRSLPELRKYLHEAQPGDLVVWHTEQPDRAYHYPQARDSLQDEIDDEYRRLAREIAKAVNVVADDKHLRVIITSDHGRFMGLCNRELPVPIGAESHGRAAWGNIDVVIGNSGYVIQDEVAYLEAGTYRLPKQHTYAVSLTGSSFLTNDGKTGSEWFPHGGIFPEEVYVPWIVTHRETRIVQPSLSLAGHGQAGERGVLQLLVSNPNVAQIFVDSAVLKLRGREIFVDISSDINAMTSDTIDVPLDNWPTPQECESPSATVVLRMPDQTKYSHEVPVSLVSESMYEKSNILEDLLP